MLILFYSLLFLLSVIDFLFMKRTRRDVLTRLCFHPVSLWMGALGVALIIFLLCGDQRGISVTVSSFLQAMFFIILVPAGGYWTLRARAPFMPYMHSCMKRQTKPPGMPASMRSKFPRDRRHPARIITLFALLLGIPLLISILLHGIVGLKPSDQMVRLLALDSHSLTSNAVFVAFLVVCAPVNEELFFRHYLQNRIAGAVRVSPVCRRFAPVVAVAAAAILFCLVHAAMASPMWLKFAQIAPLGAALGICQYKIGIEACIVLHLVFNMSMAVVSALI
ncbi:MAG: CPBP family intramembrane glutamic endopeptidase [bacterium]